MKTRFFAFAAIAVMLVNIAAFAKPDTRRKTAKQLRAAKLVTMLPASDGVVSFDARRFLTDALPKALSANQPMLAEVTAKLNEMESRTGIDLRKFEQVAVGVAFKEISAKQIDVEPVAIASGDVNAGALIAVARLASKGTYRTESIAGRTVYIFAAKDVFQKTSARAVDSKIAEFIGKALDGMTKDVAVAAFDDKTLVMGSLARVAETLEGKSRVAAELSSLLSVKESAVVSFAARTPGGMGALIPLENDEFGKNIDSIQYLSGSLDMGPTGAGLSVVARTKRADQAQALRETLDGLMMVGKAIFGNSKRPDQQVYGRMIKAAKVDQKGTDISLDILIAQADIDALIGKVR